MHIAVGLGKGKCQEKLESSGVNRRDFLKFCGAVAVTLGLGPGMGESVAQTLLTRRESVVYMHLAECTGCSEALIRCQEPMIDSLILETISLDYHETIMAAAGEAAEEALEVALKNPYGYIAVAEGAIPMANDGKFGYVGGHTMFDLGKKVFLGARAVISMGTCASYGGIQAAKPNPTGAVGINEAYGKLGVKAINLPGCPPNPLNFAAAVVALLQGKELKLDEIGRPQLFYGVTVHELCERRKHFDAGEFAPSFNSEEARKGWCLYDLGCRGPETYNNCPKILFNGTNWPVRAGHPCIGCSEPNFWDRLTPFYSNV